MIDYSIPIFLYKYIFFIYYHIYFIWLLLILSTYKFDFNNIYCPYNLTYYKHEKIRGVYNSTYTEGFKKPEGE